MSGDGDGDLLCYNRGCGKKFKSEENNKEACTFHPGTPVFHDAYKGWSCCNKKCTDFTEFLNIKGCKTSFHSNEKPPEPEKPVVDKEKAAEVIEVRPPQESIKRLPRPAFDSPLITMKPIIANSLLTQLKSLILQSPGSNLGSGDIPLGTICKRGGCKTAYEGPDANSGPCIHHPGQPIFHEGLKFWSCCTKRTTDFNAFLEQVGCTTGEHKWTADVDPQAQASCRWDWHQTGGHVIISVYAKKYDPNKSIVQLNPVRAKIDLYFPESNSHYQSDNELRGIIDVNSSEVNMLGTKVEVKLKKAELGSWSSLSFPRPELESEKKKTKVDVKEENIVEDDDLVDLSDL